MAGFRPFATSDAEGIEAVDEVEATATSSAGKGGAGLLVGLMNIFLRPAGTHERSHRACARATCHWPRTHVCTRRGPLWR
jgi:hypothetical protein